MEKFLHGHHWKPNLNLPLCRNNSLSRPAYNDVIFNQQQSALFFSCLLWFGVQKLIMELAQWFNIKFALHIYFLLLWVVCLFAPPLYPTNPHDVSLQVTLTGQL